MLDITGRVPDEVPAHWLVYFAVEDTDATHGEGEGAAAASVTFGPMDIPVGRFAVAQRPVRRRLRGDQAQADGDASRPAELP